MSNQKEKPDMNKPKLIVIVAGGVVQDIVADQPVEIVLLDHDAVREGTGPVPSRQALILPASRPTGLACKTASCPPSCDPKAALSPTSRKATP
jgi:hypothetical protein